MRFIDKLIEWLRMPLDGQYFVCPECNSNDAVHLLGERDWAVCRTCLHKFRPSEEA